MSIKEATSQPDSEMLLRRVVEVISNAKSMPLSASVLISKDEVLELLEEAVNRLPEDLRQARWILHEREELLEKARHEGEEIVEAARVRAERMVQRTEIVRDAHHSARRTLDEAREESRRLRHEADAYCDKALAQFEIVLERTTRTVQAGREKLQRAPRPGADEASLSGADSSGLADQAEDAFFDQDR